MHAQGAATGRVPAFLTACTWYRQAGRQAGKQAGWRETLGEQGEAQMLVKVMDAPPPCPPCHTRMGPSWPSEEAWDLEVRPGSKGREQPDTAQSPVVMLQPSSLLLLRLIILCFPTCSLLACGASSLASSRLPPENTFCSSGLPPHPTCPIF